MSRLDDFLRQYEMESLQLGIPSRKDVIAQVKGFFGGSQGDSAALDARQMTRLAKARAARAAATASTAAAEQDHAHWELVLAGNTKECFRNRLRNVQMMALSSAIIKAKLEGITVLDFRYNFLGEEHDEDDGESKYDEEGEAERKYSFDSATSLAKLLQVGSCLQSVP